MTDQPDSKVLEQVALARILGYRDRGVALLTASPPPPRDWIEDEQARQAWTEQNRQGVTRLQGLVESNGYRPIKVMGIYTGQGCSTNAGLKETYLAVPGASRAEAIRWAAEFGQKFTIYVGHDGVELPAEKGDRIVLGDSVSAEELKVRWAEATSRDFGNAEDFWFPVIETQGWSACLVAGFWVRKAQKLVEQGLPVDTIAHRLLSTMEPK